MEDQSNKSQDATPHKLAEARKKGQIARSAEFVSMVSLICMTCGLILALPKLSNIFSIYLINWFHNTSQMAKSPDLIFLYFSKFFSAVFSVIGLIMLIGVMGSILASLAHSGPVFSFHPLKFDLTKINPVTGFKKIFSRRGLIEIVKLILKVSFFSISLVFVWHQIANIIFFPNSFSLVVLAKNWQLALIIMVSVLLIVYLLFALFDLWYSKRDFAKKMRMSMKDIKDELKNNEGSPEIKHKRKKIMLLLLRNMKGMANLREADVVITNPTHYAVALKYRSKTMVLPIVLTKGKGFFAKWIIERARIFGVPVMRYPTLARKIFAETEVEGVIPSSDQDRVAEIYRKVIKMNSSKVFS